MGGDVSDLLTKDLLNVTEVLRRVDPETLSQRLCTPALVELGRRLVKDEVEPLEVFRDLAFSFKDSSGDAAISRAEAEAKMAETEEERDLEAEEEEKEAEACGNGREGA